MIGLTAKELQDLNDAVRSHYSKNIPGGKINPGSLAGIVEKPQMKIGGHLIHDTIFKQAACILEGVIRLHPFPDGNKRTALLATHYFLLKNNNYLVTPLDSIRFMVNVAKSEARTDSDISDLIDEIAGWLKERTAADMKGYEDNLRKYIRRPALKLLLISFSGIGIWYVNRKIDYWFATDMHPEYKKNMRTTWTFLMNMSFGLEPFMDDAT